MNARTTLVVTCLAQFILILNVVVMNIAVPSVMSDLGIPEGRVQLASIAYTLTFGSLLIVSGRAGDLFGTRRLFLGGIVALIMASLLVGLAPTGELLFLGRAVQGIAAALVSPTAFAILTRTTSEGPDRNRAMGYWGAVGSAGAIAGHLIGGMLIDTLTWRSIFLINLPVGITMLWFAFRSVPRLAILPGTLDVRGAALLTIGLATFVSGLIRIPEHGTDLSMIVTLGAALAILILFIVVERRTADPLIRFGLLTHYGTRTGNLTLLLMSGSITSVLFFATLYLQNILGYSALEIGVFFTPVTALNLVLAARAAPMAARFGARRLLVAGLIIQVLSFVVLGLSLSPTGSYWANVMPGLFLMATGTGVSFAPMFIIGTSGVAVRDQGMASGLLATSQELGAATGLAMLAAVAALVSGHGAGIAATLNGYRAIYLVASLLLVIAIGVVLRNRTAQLDPSTVPVSPAAIESGV